MRIMKYEIPEMDIVVFETEDVITTSFREDEGPFVPAN